MPRKASGHQKHDPVFMDIQLPDGDWSTNDGVSFYKVSPKDVYQRANIQP